MLRVSPILALVLLFVQSSAAIAACPARDVTVADASAIGYRERGGRCEGVFRQPVAASARLNIIGFHRHAPKFVTASGAPLTVAARVGGVRAKVAVRVVSTRQRQYYRLDATLDAAGRFDWPRDIIDNAQVALAPADVAAVACVDSCDGPQPRIVPLSISEGAPAAALAAVQGVTVWLRAAVDLRQMFIRIERQADRKPVMTNEEVLGGRVLPAGAARDLFVPLGPGTYVLRATGVPAGANAVDEIRAVLIIE